MKCFQVPKIKSIPFYLDKIYKYTINTYIYQDVETNRQSYKKGRFKQSE